MTAIKNYGTSRKLPFARQINFFMTLILTPVLLLLWITHSDLTRREIPDLAVLGIAFLGLIALCIGHDKTPLLTLLLATTVLILLWTFSTLYWLRTGREALGLGDVKLLAAGALLVGATNFWIMLLLASAGGIVAALISPKGRKQGIPFGPFIAYAIFITLALPDLVP